MLVTKVNQKACRLPVPPALLRLLLPGPWNDPGLSARPSQLPSVQPHPPIALVHVAWAGCDCHHHFPTWDPTEPQALLREEFWVK